MVIGDGAVGQQVPPPSQFGGASIDNIMSGIENTGTVRMNNHRKKLRQRFDIIKKLGQGTYGKVQLGINKESGQEVAIKTIKKNKIETEADLIRIRREVQIMSSVQHPNIIHIYEVFENREKMVLVMEFAAGGELYDYLSERKVLSEEEARRIFRQVATAIYYCHKHKICHRDLKLENILLDEHGNAKIADFGLSNVFDEQRLLATFCGSPLYASPEIVKGTPYLGPEVDCWSLGVLLYTLVYGAMPFDGTQFKRLVKQISMGDYFEPKKPSRASPLVKEMLTVCPKRRANIESICNHWWVNEGYNESCLTLAEELANQTPVRLDVLLSLAPPSVTADQLVVATPEDTATANVQRSHSVGSVIEMGETEAERRIIDMVQAGGEAALMPSPTRTITPSEAMAQPKRKLEPTQSTEIATGGVRKKDKQTDQALPLIPSPPIEAMDITPSPTEQKPAQLSNQELEKVDKMCDELLNNREIPKQPYSDANEVSEMPVATTSKEKETPKEKEKPAIKKFFNKGKTVDLSGAIKKVSETHTAEIKKIERKNSLPEDLKPERRKSRILETAEKFQSMNNQNNEKYKKFVIPGVSVGSFKKEFEKKASITPTHTTVGPLERKQRNSESSTSRQNSHEEDSKKELLQIIEPTPALTKEKTVQSNTVKESDSKSSVGSFSLEEARRSMENSIALLNQAKSESGKQMDQLCTRTEGVALTEDVNEREKKLKSAREIISNAIPRLGGGRKPPMPFGANGRTPSGNLATGFSRPVKLGDSPPSNTPTTTTIETPVFPDKADNEQNNDGTLKTSRAEITLKSATLPRRKPAKTEILVDLQTKQNEPINSMRFSTEMQHQVPDMRTPPNVATVTLQSRSNSNESQSKDHIVGIQKPPSYQRTTSTRSGTLSRQSTNESNDSDTTISQTLNTSASTSSQQPIKKSPREFIIPIAVEGGGVVTPRATSAEPSEVASNSTSSFASSKRIIKPRKLSSLLSEDDDFSTLKRHTSLSRESDSEEPRFHTMHRLRSSKPSQRGMQEPNDSGSSGDEDDEDGFEILTAENLFSTLLSRVKALTQRVNANNNFTSNFPSSRLFDEMRQARSPFWNHEPFGSRINNGSNPWRSTLSRDLHSDFDSMFSRSGATLPRGTKTKNFKQKANINNNTIKDTKTPNDANNNPQQDDEEENLDLADLDLSQLRLTKKDLQTLSSLTPSLSKKVQNQLLAQLPPTQAKKLSRTLSLLNGNNRYEDSDTKSFRRSHSAARDTNLNSKDYAKLADSKSVRASSVARDIISPPLDYKSYKFPYYSEAKGKYSPYSSGSSNYDYDRSRGTVEYETSISPPNCYESLPTRIVVSPNKEHGGRPPSGCFSPPPTDSTLRRRSSRRISRFLRPDFYDTPKDESAYVREKKEREAETQRVLREIRERSRDRSESRESKTDREINTVNFANNKEHLRLLLDTVDSNIENLENQIRRRSMSRDLFDGGDNNPIKLTDRILDDLHNITMLHKNSSREKSVLKDHEITSSQQNTNDPQISKDKIERDKNVEPRCARRNSREKSPHVQKERSVEIIKEILVPPKIVQVKDEPSKAKKVSKLVRPKSYPSKEPAKKVQKQKSSDGILEPDTLIEKKKLNESVTSKIDIPEGSKTEKPRTASKLSTPKENSKESESAVPKKVVKKKIKKDGDSSSTTENDAKIKKKSIKKNIVKVEEKIEKKEETLGKEKSPEKKLNKGFLTTIQQKFERFRESTKANREAKKCLKENGSQEVIKIKSPERALSTTPVPSLHETQKIECKSKIDAMIRTLREKSVSREIDMTESNLIKRAVSVEDMPDTMNKASVNRVLGLFKKIEKDKGPKSVKSTSYLLSMNQNKDSKERPKSTAFVNNKIKKANDDVANDDNVPILFTCPDCEKEDKVQKREKVLLPYEKERLKSNRKGLMLDLKANGHSRTISNISFPPPHPKDLAETPSYENIANFSTESQSSSTNIVSPSDEPDLYFDDWSSTCSDEQLMMSSSTSLSRFSRFSHISGDEPSNENVLDRIRRRSFFPRFNEKKERRVSSIVGPAAREYYKTAPRSASKTRAPEYNSSQTTSLTDTYRPKYSSDYNANPTRSRRYGVTSTYDTSSSGTSSLYNANRRPSYTNSGSVLPGIDSYATLGRKPRSYEHRTVSLLDSNLSRRETEMGLEREDILRKSMRTRNSSIPRSPTNNVNV